MRVSNFYDIRIGLEWIEELYLDIYSYLGHYNYLNNEI